jgi:flavodoxin
MKTAIVVASKHHGNTRKLVDRIAASSDVTVIDALRDSDADLSCYELIGFASGIACGRIYKQISDCIEKRLPEGKRVFFLYTCARDDKDFMAAARQSAEARGCKVLGAYGCTGFNTFGPLKLFGGMNKGHPDEKELAGALSFFEALTK